MEKRYQVFISSTYHDLIDERQAAIQACLDLKCFPSTMENFAAAPVTPASYIRKVIEPCDYYILILGGKYGSIHEESGKSYTEFEYDIAQELQIPILVFYKNPKKIYHDNADSDPEIVEKREKFHSRAKKNLAKIFNNDMDLKASIAISLKDVFDSNERPGWIRSDFAEESVLSELTELRTKNEDLKKLINEMKKQISQDKGKASLNLSKSQRPRSGPVPLDNIYRMYNGNYRIVFQDFIKRDAAFSYLREIFPVLKDHMERNPETSFITFSQHVNIDDIEHLLGKLYEKNLMKPISV